MNEKIQKLAEESGLDVKTMGFENNQYQHDPWNARLSKFTQLIIRDCYSVIIKSQRGHFNPATSWDAVKEHFGVKE